MVLLESVTVTVTIDGSTAALQPEDWPNLAIAPISAEVHTQ